jgi:transcriptional regulator with XRE-family HTH domain
MVMESKELGKIIRTRRKVLNLTIGELSEYTGLSRTTISDIELGKTNPRLDVITEIFRFLNLEMKIEVKHIE